jgi:hypothetical protein
MSFSEEKVQQVWEKAATVENNDPKRWRKDQCGAWIDRGAYGNRNSEYGWEVDHIDPNGGDSLDNLRPLQWKNNLARGQGRLNCPVIAEGVHNIDRST